MRPHRLRGITLPTPLSRFHIALPVGPIFRNPPRVNIHTACVRNQDQDDDDVGEDELIGGEGCGLEAHEQPLGWVAQEQDKGVDTGDEELVELHGWRGGMF
jgi:hypothetical protein